VTGPRDPSRRSDYLDAIKFIPLSANGDWHLTLGGLGPPWAGAGLEYAARAAGVKARHGDGGTGLGLFACIT
jgi:hypothetical protein